jgi:hypothetical protein
MRHFALFISCLGLSVLRLPLRKYRFLLDPGICVGLVADRPPSASSGEAECGIRGTTCRGGCDSATASRKGRGPAGIYEQKRNDTLPAKRSQGTNQIGVFARVFAPKSHLVGATRLVSDQ